MRQGGGAAAGRRCDGAGRVGQAISDTRFLHRPIQSAVRAGALELSKERQYSILTLPDVMSNEAPSGLQNPKIIVRWRGRAGQLGVGVSFGSRAPLHARRVNTAVCMYVCTLMPRIQPVCMLDVDRLSLPAPSSAAADASRLPSHPDAVCLHTLATSRYAPTPEGKESIPGRGVDTNVCRP